jgi:AbrB family looped-hinge helix DNA binding protein
MRTAIDRSGRVVIPKRLRAAVGLENGGEVEIEVRDGRIEIEPISVPKRLVERDGKLVIVAEGDVPPVTTEEVRALLDKLRR